MKEEEEEDEPTLAADVLRAWQVATPRLKGFIPKTRFRWHCYSDGPSEKYTSTYPFRSEEDSRC